jgi:uncharacterized protein YkwD
MKKLFVIAFTLLSISLFSQTNEELLMVKEINELRTNPKSYMGYVEKYIKSNVRKIEKIKDGTATIKSSDGKSGLEVINRNIKAAQELLSILDTLTPLDTLVFNIDMYLITKSHAQYLDSTNKFSHYSENGDRAYQRFKNLKVDGVTENLSGVSSYRKTFKPLITNLLIDSGIENRGHRNNLLNPKSRFVSVGIVDGVCVQNFAH